MKYTNKYVYKEQIDLNYNIYENIYEDLKDLKF